MAAPPESRCDAEEAYPFADLTLRAGVDGATVRVHRGVVATYSRVLREVLMSTNDDTLTLPGKGADEVKLLVAWLYRAEKTMFTRVSASSAGASVRCMCLATWRDPGC